MTSTISEPTVGRETRRAGDGQRSKLKPDFAGRESNGRRLGSGKLAVPAPGVPLLHRHRVTDLISAATTRRVTLVCAPTGAGKTIACAMWASSRPAADSIAWVSLDPGDRQPGQLWAHVGAALADLPEFGRGLADELVDTAAAVFPLRLAEAAKRLPSPVILVIDDVQELADSEPLADLDVLVRHGPPNLRLLLAGRHLAGLGVARLRVGGELAEIGAADLACTPSEAQAYFSMLGVDVPAPQLDELLGRTQGWITGLRLAAMRTGPGQGAAAPWRISGDEPLVADYLQDEILATLPEDHRGFLLRTSVADRICGDLADTLTATDGGAAMLDRLCRENVLIRPISADTEPAGPARPAASAGPVTPVAPPVLAGPGAPPMLAGPREPGATEYRYHPLLLDLLRAQLRRELPAELPSLARRAAGWQAAHGRHAEALRNSAQTGDWDFAAQILSVAGPELLLPATATALEPVLATFPASRYTSDAPVAGALAAAGLRTGDSYATELHLDNAETALRQCPDGQRQIVGTWLLALRLMHATGRGTVDPDLIDRGLELADQVGPTIRESADHQALGLLWTAIGVATLARLRITDARDALARACGPLRVGRPEFLAQATGWRAVTEAMYGDLLTADELAAEPLLSSDAADPASRQLTDLAASYLHLARDETAIARRRLDRCEQAGPGQNGWGQVVAALAGLARARIALCEGDHAGARRQVSRLRYECVRSGSGSRQRGGVSVGVPLAGSRSAIVPWAGPAGLDGALATLDADVALGEGNVPGARLALSRVVDGSIGNRADLMLGLAKVLLAEGDSHAALDRAQTCLSGQAGQVTLRDQISALTTAAVAHRRLGQAEQAADQLAHALVLAEPHGLYRPFLDGGSATRSALTVLVRPTSQGAAVAAKILQRFDTRPARPARSADTPATVPLTGSELAVLRFLPSHMTNQEIAEALFLSINTVKTHLRSVYRKLGVTTRRQAISTAGRLGLI
jgi:LuxR family transcriptional regulator, maltose regulon positive regulatory protein